MLVEFKNCKTEWDQQSEEKWTMDNSQCRSLGRRAGINKGSWGVAGDLGKLCAGTANSLLDRRSQWLISSVRCWWQFKTCTLKTNKTAKSVWNTNLLKHWLLPAKLKSWNDTGYAMDCYYSFVFGLNIPELPGMLWSPHVLHFLTSV